MDQKNERLEDPQCGWSQMFDFASAQFNWVLSFHKFPNDNELQKRCVVDIQQDTFSITYQIRICSWHFQSTDLMEPPTPADRQDHDHCSTSEPAALDLALDHTEDLCAEIARLQKQKEEMATSNSNKFDLEWFAGSDNNIR